MTKVQIVSSKNSAWYLFRSKKGYKSEIWSETNKILFENLVFTVFYQKILATIIYVSKNIAKMQQGCKVKL